MLNIDLIQAELEIGFLESAALSTFIDSDVFMESSSDSTSVFDKMIEKVKTVIKKVKSSITEFLTSKTVDKQLNDLKEKINEDPSLKNQTATMVDYDKLDKLNTSTLKELEKTDDPEAVITKYRKQRNVILAASAAVTVTLGTALVMITKNKNKRINKLDDQLKQAESSLTKLKHRYVRVKNKAVLLSNENEKLNKKLELQKEKSPVGKSRVLASQTKDLVVDKVTTVRNNTSKGADNIKKTAQLEMEVLKNASTDVLSSVKDVVNVCTNASTGKVKKTMAVAKGVASTAKTASKLASGEIRSNTINEEREKLKGELTKMKVRIEKGVGMLNDPNASEEKKKKVKEMLPIWKQEASKIASQYKSLSK